MKMKLVLFSLALAVVAACSGTTSTQEATAQTQEALQSCRVLPGGFSFGDGNEHSINETVIANSCPGTYPPVGTVGGGVAGVSQACRFQNQGPSCFDIICPNQPAGSGNNPPAQQDTWQYVGTANAPNAWYQYQDLIATNCHIVWAVTVLN